MTGAAAPRVVVVKLAALGDLVMASTLVHAVRTRWPQAHLTWVTGAPLVPLAQRLEGIDRVVPVDTQALLAGGLAHRARAMAQAWWRVGRTPYDLGVVAHTDPRYALLLQGARVRTVRHFRVTPPRRGEYMGNPPTCSGRQKWSYAARANFIDGVMPPNAILGRSLLYVQSQRVADACTASIVSRSVCASQS